ncbi:MAG: hypothetical protein WBB18_02435, partial [Nodosilinea sp.]
MLKSSRILEKEASRRLLGLWAKRYRPTLFNISLVDKAFPVADLLELTTPSGRASTAKRVKILLSSYCQLAGLRTNSLYAYIPNVIDLSEAYHLARAVEQ